MDTLKKNRFHIVPGQIRRFREEKKYVYYLVLGEKKDHPYFWNLFLFNPLPGENNTATWVASVIWDQEVVSC